jgi:DNA-directed RNA polymerase specialized sigma24 family protein
MAISHSESVTGWVRQARSGDEEAARKLWERYFHRIVDVARARLGMRRAAFDEEDVALSSFDRVMRALRLDLVNAPADRFEFWGLLTLNLRRRLADRRKMEGAVKQGGGRDSEKPTRRCHRSNESLDRLPARVDDPQIAAAMAETCRLLLGSLQDEELEQVAVWKLEGLTDDEIAAKLCYSRRTVQRMLRNIRTLWSRQRNLPSD